MNKILIMLIALVLAISAPAIAQPTGKINKIGIADHNGSFALSPSTYRDVESLTATVEGTMTVPTGPDGTTKAAYVLFAARTAAGGVCSFAFSEDSTAVYPSGDITTGLASDIDPTIRFLGGRVTTLHLISPVACLVTVQYWMSK